MADRFGLGVDEAHYVMYARKLAWGYLDHPPMVAFLAALTQSFGQGAFWTRLGPIICSFLSLVLLRRLALRLQYDERICFWALVLLLAMPYQHLLMVALLPDAPLNLFWCGALLAFWMGVTGGHWRAWIAAGLLLGGALLSKYHAVMLPFCLGGYLLASPARRHWIKRPQPYAAALVALAVYLPNLIWNARHDWMSFAFQLSRGGKGGLEWEGLLAAAGGQLGVWSPVIFCLLAAAWWELIRRPSRDEERFLVWTSLPVFAFFIASGAMVKVLPHWTAAGWWSGSLAVAAVALEKIGGGKTAVRWRRWTIIGILIGLLMTTALYAGLLMPIVRPLYGIALSASQQLHRHVPAIRPLAPYQAKFDISNELFGWEAAAEAVETFRSTMPDPQKTFVFCHRFYDAGQLGVHLPADRVVTTLGRKIDQYRLWFDPRSHLQWDAVFVDVDRRMQGPNRYLPLFGEVDPTPEVISIRRGAVKIREIRLYRYFGYKGGYQQ